MQKNKREKVVVKSMDCVSKVSDNGKRASDFNHSETEIHPWCKINVVCWRGFPLSFCQPPQAVLNPFLLASDFAVLPALHFILITPGFLHLRISKQQQPPCYYISSLPTLSNALGRHQLFTVNAFWKKESRWFLCLGVFNLLRKATHAAFAQIPSSVLDHLLLQ